ncbi:MAG: hypothetical protein WBB29_16910 [Geitlerinemataceae cyanobacterium]
MSVTRSPSSSPEARGEARGSLKHQIDRLIFQLGQEVDRHAQGDLERLHIQLQALYDDLYLLRNIYHAQETLNPGDILTHEEAIDFLSGYNALVLPNFDGKTASTKRKLPANIEIRYCRSFLLDLKRLDLAAYGRLYQMTLIDWSTIAQVSRLSGLRPLGGSTILYRLTLDAHLIGIEIKGRIIKFVRVLSEARI